MVQSPATQTPFLVSIDGEPPISWATFCADNADAFDADELATIAVDVQRDGVYVAGGGALPDFEIRLVTRSAEVA